MVRADISRGDLWCCGLWDLEGGMSAQTILTDTELWLCIDEADKRRADSSWPIDVRVRSFETYSLLLQVAKSRGYSYATLKAAATAQEGQS